MSGRKSCATRCSVSDTSSEPEGVRGRLASAVEGSGAPISISRFAASRAAVHSLKPAESTRHVDRAFRSNFSTRCCHRALLSRAMSEASETPVAAAPPPAGVAAEPTLAPADVDPTKLLADGQRLSAMKNHAEAAEAFSKAVEALCVRCITSPADDAGRSSTASSRSRRSTRSSSTARRCSRRPSRRRACSATPTRRRRPPLPRPRLSLDRPSPSRRAPLRRSTSRLDRNSTLAR